MYQIKVTRQSNGQQMIRKSFNNWKRCTSIKMPWDWKFLTQRALLRMTGDHYRNTWYGYTLQQEKSCLEVSQWYKTQTDTISCNLWKVDEEQDRSKNIRGVITYCLIYPQLRRLAWEVIWIHARKKKVGSIRQKETSRRERRNARKCEYPSWK